MRRVTRFSVGTRRIGSNTVAATAKRDVRAQMALLDKRFTKAIHDISGITPEAIRKALQPVYNLASFYCPVDTGVLRDSEYLEVRKEASGWIGWVGFAKGDHPNYAVIVHERLDLNHEYPTRAKYLQLAAEQVANEIPSILSSHYRSRF